MINRYDSMFVAAVMSASAIAVPAWAQKSADTLRVALLDPLKTVDSHYDPKQETDFVTMSVFDTLIRHDDRGGGFKPLLAKSWTRTSDTVTEYELRKDVKWHDGETFDADDVLYTLDWLRDPKTKLRNKRAFRWIKSVEKLGPHKIRITAKKLTVIDFWHMNRLRIYPEHIHSKLENKSTFGHKPVGTGPFKVTAFGRNEGVTVEKNTAYRSPGAWRVVGSIGRLQTTAIPEVQTQVAQLKVGGVDLIQGLPKDQVDVLRGDSNLIVTANRNLLVLYFLLDARGRAGLEALKDPRVRRAIYMAVDRKAISQNFIAGGEEAANHGALCDPRQFGCEFTEKVAQYDPAGAKKLLAEAGYADGFDFVVSATPRGRPAAEAITGYLRKVGIRATVQPLTSATYRKLQQAGKLQSLIHTFSFLGIADVDVMMGFFYSPGSREMAGDSVMFELTKQGSSTRDAAKRRTIYTKALNRINAMSYNMVVSAFPAVFVHSKDVRIRTGSMAPYGATVEDISWK